MYKEQTCKPVAGMPPRHLGLQAPHTTEAREGDGAAQVLVGIGSVEHADTAPRRVRQLRRAAGTSRSPAPETPIASCCGRRWSR